MEFRCKDMDNFRRHPSFANHKLKKTALKLKQTEKQTEEIGYLPSIFSL